MQPFDVVVRQVEIKRFLDVLIRHLDPFVPLTHTREVPCPMDRQAHRTQCERVIVHVRMKLVRARYACTYSENIQRINNPSKDFNFQTLQSLHSTIHSDSPDAHISQNTTHVRGIKH